MEPLPPKKFLGQHFLKNTTAIMQSINALRLTAGDIVIEIGPGTGALTWPLVSQCERIGCRYIGIEKDGELAGRLIGESVSRLSGKTGTGFEIITGDALLVLPELITRLTNQPTSYRIIGNIPYYITGQLLRVISELKHKPNTTVLMVQKEVAERICAKSPETNLLSAATQVWSKAQLLLTLKPSDFEPAPAVHSAVIELITKKTLLTAQESEQYYAMLHRIFKQPRKTLVNNLISEAVIPNGIEPISRTQAEALLTKLKIPTTARPQDLSIEQCQSLAKELTK
jgi:16S rRNA (adenine1518-N6/adenine1519-N6)-dimethyltransferase